VILDSSYIFELDSDAAFQKGVALAEDGVQQRIPTPVITESGEQYLAGDLDTKELDDESEQAASA